MEGKGELKTNDEEPEAAAPVRVITEAGKGTTNVIAGTLEMLTRERNRK